MHKNEDVLYCFANGGALVDQFVLKSKYSPSGDQPQAIEKLVEGLKRGDRHQVLLGATGTGKTFTMANIIERVQRPALVIAHNKTLAAQLCAEFKELFPDSAVEYFVSYYDYYQPEAYIPSSDTYIEKDSSINEEIDKLRHSATAALTERRDVVIVASVSCIYSLGDPDEYRALTLSLREGQKRERDELLNELVNIQYERNDFDFQRGTFRVRGDTVEIAPIGDFDKALRVEFFGDEIEKISEIDTTTGHALKRLKHALVFPATHYATTRESMDAAVGLIEADMEARVRELTQDERLVEAQRLRQRTTYDIEMIREIGYCSGIENYSRYFDGRKPGDAPFTLISYFPDDFIVMIDESHQSIPQIRAMYNGDRARKEMLVDYGFRLPSAFDNRPLRFSEFEARVKQCIYVSATPGPYELGLAQQVAQQIIRPTGLIDPEIIVRPARGQVDDLYGEIRGVIDAGNRVLVTTLTKRMAENLTQYFKEMGLRVKYLHSDVQTLERLEIIRDLRLGAFDVLVGINLLREGLDLPEVSLVAILDADKEGFLRSETSLVQTIGRAARNVGGRVIMYADAITNSMERAIAETNRRREVQMAYNIEHNITPATIRKAVAELLMVSSDAAADTRSVPVDDDEKQEALARLEEQMVQAAAQLDFEKAAKVRDQIYKLKGEDVVAQKEQRKRRPVRRKSPY